jgi:flagellar biosynthesis component FlhA
LLVKAGISAGILAIMLVIPGAGFIIGIMKQIATYLLYWNLGQVIVQALLKPEDHDDSPEDLSKKIDKQKEENEEKIKKEVEEDKEDKDKEDKDKEDKDKK